MRFKTIGKPGIGLKSINKDNKFNLEDNADTSGQIRAVLFATQAFLDFANWDDSPPYKNVINTTDSYHIKITGTITGNIEGSADFGFQLSERDSNGTNRFWPDGYHSVSGGFSFSYSFVYELTPATSLEALYFGVDQKNTAYSNPSGFSLTAMGYVLPIIFS